MQQTLITAIIGYVVGILKLVITTTLLLITYTTCLFVLAILVVLVRSIQLIKKIKWPSSMLDHFKRPINLWSIGSRVIDKQQIFFEEASVATYGRGLRSLQKAIATTKFKLHVYEESLRLRRFQYYLKYGIFPEDEN